MITIETDFQLSSNEVDKSNIGNRLDLNNVKKPYCKVICKKIRHENYGTMQLRKH